MIDLYKGTITAGGADGEKITDANPLIVVLNSANNEEAVVELGARTESGYKTVTATTIEIIGDNKDKWCLSQDGAAYGNWGATLTITDIIQDSNLKLYAKAKCEESEGALVDNTVSFRVSTTIGNK